VSVPFPSRNKDISINKQPVLSSKGITFSS